MNGSISTITAADLCQRLGSAESLWLVDVRSSEAFDDWHIPGSLHCHADSIDSIAQQQIDRQPVLICNRGIASYAAAETLARLGRSSIVVADGLKGWNRCYEPRALAVRSAHGLRVVQIVRLGKGCLSYLIMNENRECIVVDPGQHQEAYQEIIAHTGCRVVAVIDTHLHADHLSGGPEIAAAHAIPYYLPEGSATTLPFKTLCASDPVLAPFHLQILSTPGHTTESVSLLVDNCVLLVGDLIFPTTVGRSDLAQDVAANAHLLYESIHRHLLTLPDATLVCSAHLSGPELPSAEPRFCTIGSIRRENEIVRFPSAEDFVAYAASALPATPPNFLTIKQTNRGLVPLPGDGDELELGANRCAVSISPALRQESLDANC